MVELPNSVYNLISTFFSSFFLYCNPNLQKTSVTFNFIVVLQASIQASKSILN